MPSLRRHSITICEPVSFIQCSNDLGFLEIKNPIPTRDGINPRYHPNSPKVRSASLRDIGRRRPNLGALMIATYTGWALCFSSIAPGRVQHTCRWLTSDPARCWASLCLLLPIDAVTVSLLNVVKFCKFMDLRNPFCLPHPNAPK